MKITTEEIRQRQIMTDLDLRQQRINGDEYVARSAEIKEQFSAHLRDTYMSDVVGDEAAKRAFEIAMEAAVDQDYDLDYSLVEDFYARIADVVDLVSWSMLKQ